MIRKVVFSTFFILVAICTVLYIRWQIKGQADLAFISHQLNVESNWAILDQAIRKQFPVGMSRQDAHQKAIQLDPETSEDLLFEKGEEFTCESRPCCERVFLFYNRIGRGGGYALCYNLDMKLTSITVNS